ncbi:MAG: hypothetical protein ABID45_00345, partial [Patescibacteria group bacterium]
DFYNNTIYFDDDTNVPGDRSSIFRGLFTNNSNTDQAEIYNNIIYLSQPNGSGDHGGIQLIDYPSSQNPANPQSIFKNNLVYTTANIEDCCYNTALSTNNIIDEDPAFINATIKNFELEETSPAKNAGLNGEDLGAFGGSYTFNLDITN